MEREIRTKDPNWESRELAVLLDKCEQCGTQEERTLQYSTYKRLRDRASGRYGAASVFWSY